MGYEQELNFWWALEMLKNARDLDFRLLQLKPFTESRLRMLFSSVRKQQLLTTEQILNQSER